MFTLFFLLFSLGAMAQITVKGKIVDTQNEPLMGVNVVLQGTTAGTLTNIDGLFTMEVPDSKSTLSISYIGYKRQNIVVGSTRNFNVILHEDLQNLDEVVVVGYGVQKKSHLTGSVSKLKSEGLEEIPVSNIDQVLQGRIAGVSIQNTTSEVGEAAQIRIRGTGSLSASNEPLVVIDGYPIADGLSSVDMSDVESIEVLKDAASSAIYGSRAANGVILITTKSGDFTKPKFTLKAFGGVKAPYMLHPIMTTQAYTDMRIKEAALGGAAVSNGEWAQKYIADNIGDTDWQSQALNSAAYIYNVQLGVSGGKKEVKYYVSANYTSDQGIMKHSQFDKFNMRAKLDAELSKWVTLGVSLAPSYQKREKAANSFIDFYRTYSWLPVKHNEFTAALTGRQVGDWAHGRDFNNLDYWKPNPTDPLGDPVAITNVSPWNTANNNPACVMENERVFQTDYQMVANAYLQLNFNKYIYFKTSNGFNVKYRESDGYRNREARRDGEPNMGSFASRLYTDFLTENTLNYNQKIGKHDIGALVGFTAQFSNNKNVGLVGVNFPTDLVPTINGATQILLNSSNTTISQSSLLSALARINWGYDDKYLVSASIRADGSSLFGPENKWGWFPSLSLGWRISEEEFLKDSGVDQLKLRASVGMTGNNDITNYAYLNILESANYPLGSGNGIVVPGLANIDGILGNRAISWEQTLEYNIGVDLSVLSSRLNFSLEYYYSITNQLLFKQPILAITGYNRQWNNIGKVRNMGIEGEVTSYNIKNKNFEWSTNFNASTNFNRLLELGGEERLINYGERNEIYLAQVGYNSVQYYGYKTVGVWTSQKEIDENPHHNLDRPGGLRVEDINKDGTINDKDRVTLGSPYPDFTWGMTNSFKLYGFDFSFTFQGTHGVELFNGDGYYQESRKINKNYVTNRWVSPNHPGDGKTPYFTEGIPWEMTDYLIEDGSYIALRDVLLGYKLRKKDVRKIGLSGLRVYAAGQNLFFWWPSSYRGINPEARMTSGDYSSALVGGYQRGGFPLQYTVTLGLEITF